MSATNRQSPFNVGDRVRVDFGRRKLTGVIVEDRGAIGAQGRHLFQIDIPMDPFEPMSVELPEDEIQGIPPGTEKADPISKQQVIEYLASGGLISILRSNLSGGKNQPRVWLCLDQLGNVTHTFIPERGVLGGELVPFSAVHGDSVFVPKRETVSTFLKSFGLNQQESEQVLSKVGAAP